MITNCIVINDVCEFDLVLYDICSHYIIIYDVCDHDIVIYDACPTYIYDMYIRRIYVHVIYDTQGLNMSYILRILEYMIYVCVMYL